MHKTCKPCRVIVHWCSLGHGKACCQQHAWPVDGVKAKDVFADDMDRGRPAMCRHTLHCLSLMVRQQTTQIACAVQASGNGVDVWLGQMSSCLDDRLTWNGPCLCSLCAEIRRDPIDNVPNKTGDLASKQRTAFPARDCCPGRSEMLPTMDQPPKPACLLSMEQIPMYKTLKIHDRGKAAQP